MLRQSLKLQDLQDQFVTQLKTKVPPACFLDHIHSKNLSSLDAFSIYRHNWRTGALKALTNVYPVCQQLVGKRAFQIMTDRYIDQYPSVSPTFYEYGAFLAEYLDGSRFVADLPYLGDVVRLEWAVQNVLLGPDDHTAFDWQTFTRMPPEHQARICFYRRENSVLYHSLFPVDRIWETNQADFMGNDRVDLNEGAVYLFIYRSGYDLRIDRLTLLQWSLLNLLNGKKPLDELPKIFGEAESEKILIELPILIKRGYITNL